MKILYDHTVFQFQRYGGISRYFFELITRLSTKENVDISIFQGIHVNEYALSEQKQNFYSYWGYKWKYKKPAAKYIALMFAVPNKILFENFMRSSDVNIYHPTYYMAGLKQNRKSPVVITAYDMIHELYPDQFIDSWFVIKAKKRAISMANVIIAISENTKKDLIKFYDVPESKIKVVYLASSLQSSKPVTLDELKKEYGIKRPYILYVGDRRRTYKNFKVLFDSYITNFSDDFDLICFGGGKFRTDEMKNISIRIKNRIIGLNGSDDLLASLYKHAFCFVYPSLYEGFGIPPLEAMSMECPVIASNASSIPEVVGEAAILFDPNSKDELIHALESLYDKSKRNDLIKRGFEQEKKFSWDKMAKETLNIYSSIL